MTFDGVSPAQQYIIDNRVFILGDTPEEAYADVMGTAPPSHAASIESIGTTYSGGPTQTNFPTNVYMGSEEVVNSGDTREIPDIDKSWGYGVDDVTKDMTEVDTGLINTEAGGILDRTAQALFQPYWAMRAVQGFVEPKHEAGTPTATVKQVLDWWDNFNLPGLVAEPTYSNESLFAQSVDDGSYTTVNGGSANGGYSYGTIDGIGVESPY